MKRHNRIYVPLMDIKVISSDLGQLFALNSNGTVCGSSFSSDKVLQDYQFVVLDSDGSEKGRYFVVGNHYDDQTKFSPKEHAWFAEGARSTLSAAEFTAGDVVRVEFERPDHLADHVVAQMQMSLWVIMTHRPGSAAFLNYDNVCKLLMQCQ